MTCARCECALTEDCRFCPQCGSPAEAETGAEGRGGTRAFGAAASAGGRTGTAVLHAPPPPEAGNALASADADPLALHRLLTQANLHRIRGQWEAAIDCCVAVLRVDPSSATAHALLGDIYRDRGSLDDAIQWYRLALDLQPNPSDEAKLRFLEADRVRQAAEAGVARRGLSSGPGGSDPTGTALLLGVSPRRWLNGITLASLVFFGFTLAILGLLQLNKPKGRGSRVAASQPVGGGFGQAATSPPPTPSAALKARPSASSSVVFSGGGPPRPVQSAPAPSVPQRSEARRPSGVGLPPAPVTAVRPTAPAAPLPGFDAAGGSEAPAATPGAPKPLTDGMRLAQTWRSPDGSETALLLTVPAASVPELGGSLREALLRNVFRAAHSSMQSGTVPASVSVYVQSDSESSAPNAETLALARVSRTSLALDPEVESVSRLESLANLRLSARALGQ